MGSLAGWGLALYQPTAVTASHYEYLSGATVVVGSTWAAEDCGDGRIGSKGCHSGLVAH